MVFVFFFSGLSALVYQIVWQRLLTVYYGVGPISIALVVTVYMLGLGLGALFGGYISERLTQRIFVYCLIELGIGLFGIFSSGFLDFFGLPDSGNFLCANLHLLICFLVRTNFSHGHDVAFAYKDIQPSDQ